MNRQHEVKTKVANYRNLQKLFLQFCADAKQALPEDNDFGVRIGSANENACDLTILGHPCRLRFEVRIEPPPMLGKLIFERLLPKDQARHLLTLYFDRLGNADEKPDPKLYTLNGSTVADFELVRLLEEFFKDIAAASPRNN